MYRTSIFRAWLCVPLVVSLLLAGCGGSSDGSTSTKGPTSTKGTKGAKGAKGADAGKASAGKAPDDTTLTLKVRLEHVGGKDAGVPLPSGIACDRRLPASCSGEIECPPPSGEQGADICAWLETPEGAATLTVVPEEHQTCTQQYGGPEVATVKGSIEGHPVDAKFSRVNGCEIARFDAVSPLWTGRVPQGTAGSREGAPAASTPHPEVIEDPPSAFGK